jgi:hypothetical protein
MSTCLAIVLYSAFDLLDVGGSELREALPSHATAIAAETERVFPQILSIPEILGSLPHAPLFRSVSEVSQPSPGLRMTTVAARLAHRRSWPSMNREEAAAMPPSGDPA